MDSKRTTSQDRSSEGRPRFQIRPSFLPIVSTYTVASSERPLEKLMKDARLLAGAFLDYREKMGYESLPLMGDSTYTAEAFGCRIGFKEREAFVTEPLRFDSEEDLREGLIPAIDDCERLQMILRAIRHLSKFSSKEQPVIACSTAPLTSAAKIVGLEHLLRNFFRKPEWVRVLLEKVTRFIVMFTEALVEAGAEIIFVPDPIASTTMISPSMFKTFAFPALRGLVDQIQRPTLLHICGDVEQIIEDMVAVRATLVSVDQCTDLRRIRRRIGNDVVLGGNLDPTDILMKTPEEVEQASWKSLKEGGPDNFVLMPGCTIVPGTPAENIQAMIRVSKEAKEWRTKNLG